MKKVILSFFLTICITFSYAQWNGTNPLWTASKVSVGSSITPLGNLHIDGAGCGYHGLVIRQSLSGCLPGSPLGNLVRVEYQNASSNFVPSFVVTADGYCGIGTYAPVTRFHLEGNGYVNGNIGIGVASPSVPLHVVGTSFFNGSVGIGISSPAQALHIVGGSIRIDNGDFMITNAGTTSFKVYSTGFVRAREVLVDLQPIPDYVFSEGYKRLSLFDLERYITQHKHLPGIKSEAEYQQQGNIGLGELSVKLLEKVEEQALYIIELNKKIEALEKRMETIEKQ